MAVIHGYQGRVTFAWNGSAGAVSNVTAWAIDATADVAESTVMQAVDLASTVHWKDYTAGFLDWTATVECLADDGGLDPDLDTDFAQDTDGIALVLYSGPAAITGQANLTPRKYSGNAIITSVAINVDKDDVAKIVYSVQGSGTLTEAASDYSP